MTNQAGQACWHAANSEAVRPSQKMTGTRRCRYAIAALLGFGGAAMGPAVSSAATNYLTDLGAVAPALGINNSGQVVLEKYFYSSGVLTAFPASFAGAGINSSGQVVGAATISTPCPATTARFGVSPCIAVWANGTLTIYPGYEGFPDFVGNYGRGINSSGQIVGNWHTGIHDYTGAILLSNGIFSDLRFPSGTGGPCTITYPASTFGPPNYAYAINDAGQIAGQAPRWNADHSAQCVEAFLYSNGVYTDIGPGAAYALNAAGQVAGYLQISDLRTQPDVTHAFRYDPSVGGPAKDLGTLAGHIKSSAYAINGSGLVVGESGTGTETAAFFYNGVMLDLNTLLLPDDPLRPYVRLTDARGINDSGLVVANGVDARDNARHAYLLQVPLIKVAPGPLVFPNQAIGTTSAPQSATFTNIGTAALALGATSVTGDFHILSSNCGSSLAVGAGCTVTVAYTPTAAGNPTSGLTLISDGVPIVVPLSGASQLSASISASAATVTAGTPVTLTWSASTGATCTATGGSAADGWTGTVASSGTRAVTENTAGTFTYGLSCTAGSQTQEVQIPTPVVVTWPTLTVTLTASPSTVTVGNPTTLTWSSANATSCVATGGGPNDGWPGIRPTSGSVQITEPYALSTPSVTLTFTITCTSSASGESASASATVVENAAPAKSGGGGGGAFDAMSLLSLLAFLWVRRRLGAVR